MVRKDILNKSDLCKILTRKLLSDLDSGMNCDASESVIAWDKYHDTLDKIEALGRFCNIDYHRKVKKYA